MKKTTIGTLALFLLPIHTTLAAEDATAEEAEESQLETIVITANRSDTQLSDVIGNASQLLSEELADIGQIHVNESLIRVPGTWISRGNGQEHLTAIRSPVLTGAGGCGAFFIAQDGISLRGPGFCNVNQLFDVNTEQAGAIEVIRGPGSSLYGSNAVHGIINVITPDVFTSQDYLGFDAGPHSYFRGSLGLSHKTDNQAFGVFGNVTNDGGYKDESGFDQQKFDFIHQITSGDYNIKSVLSVANLNQETAGFIEGFEAFRDESRKRENPNPEAFRDSKAVRGYSRIEKVINDNSSFSITPYFRYTDMRFIQHFVPWQPIEENGQRSLGVQGQYRLTRNDVEYSFGLDIDLTDGFLTEEQFIDFSPNIPIGDHYDYDVLGTTISPYVNVDWVLSDRTRLNAGVRYDYTDYDYDNNLSTGSACAPEVTNCRFIRPESQTRSFNNFSPTLGITHEWRTEQLLYAKASRGFRAPQATELFRLQQGQISADLDSEELTAFELGFRGQAAALFYDVALFLQDKDNFIFQDTNRQNVSNGETRHRGVELDLRYQITPTFDASFSGTFARHTYENNILISRTTNINGNDIDTAPRRITNFRLGWQATEDIRTELEWINLASYYLNPENTAEYDGHNLVNLRTHWQTSERIQLSARITNLTDTDYAERADFGFGNFRYFVGEPRSLYVSVRYSL
ncbi:TonB-dependent receptor [Alteromonadaceae bacterium M269]|nr:TonB-dependent receptor [Alteromonadaceae bacterium M269]